MKSATKTVYMKQFIEETSVPDWGVRCQGTTHIKITQNVKQSQKLACFYKRPTAAHKARLNFEQRLK